MSDRVIRLYGFEEGLAARIAASFHFADPGYDDVIIQGGRNLFCSTMPTVEEIAQMMQAQSAKPFDPTREPIISIGANIGIGVQPTVSSSRRQEWNTHVMLRIARAPEIAKGLLEDLFDYLILVRGRLSTKFQVKNAVALSRPTIVDVLANDLAMVSAVVKFFAVPLTN